MGNAQQNNSKKDRQALVEFLNGKANLDKIWKRFDRDGNGYIDDKKLQDLIYCVLCFFCTERDPEMAEPPREKCDPFVTKIIMDLKPTLNQNDDGVISRDEFELFGKYLNQEYDKLQFSLSQREMNEPQKNKKENKLWIRLQCYFALGLWIVDCLSMFLYYLHSCDVLTSFCVLRRVLRSLISV